MSEELAEVFAAIVAVAIGTILVDMILPSSLFRRVSYGFNPQFGGGGMPLQLTSAGYSQAPSVGGSVTAAQPSSPTDADTIQ